MFKYKNNVNVLKEYGLIAEQVENVYSDLVVYNKKNQYNIKISY
jgi:hypothetical protein